MSVGQPAAPHATRGQRIFVGVAVLAFAAVSAYLALVIITRVDSIFLPGNQITVPGGASVSKVLPGVDAEGESGSKDRINILVLGLDRRAREGDAPTRTDTVFIVTVDPKTKSTGILGIPRDLMIDIPYASGGGTHADRINTVYVTGELGDYSGGGVGLMKKVIEESLGVEIDKYVLVDFEGFETVIDALGGVDVDVPEEVYDPYYSETELPGDYLPQHFYPGVQHMDGTTALAYSRIRFSSDDLDRIQRQQRVIFATIDKAMSLDVLSNAGSLWTKYRDTIKTDISDVLIPGYAKLASQVVDDIHSVSLGPATAPYTGPHGEAFLVMDPDVAKQIVDSLFAEDAGALPDATTTPEPVLVEVQNATGRDGLASAVIDYLAAQDYPVHDLNAANVFDGELHEASEIIDVTGANHGSAYLLANKLRIPPESVRDATAAEQESLGAGNADIVIILGSDTDFETLIQSAAAERAGG